MWCRGMITGINRTLDNHPLITPELSGVTMPELKKLQEDGKLSIELKKYVNGRSLNANRLLWHCIGELANTFQRDKWQLYLEYLKRFGQFRYVVVKPEAVEDLQRHWRECEVVGDCQVNGQKGVQMLCYFGSSTYNTHEFSMLLDGVISEMEACGLETPTSEEMRRTLKEWERTHGEEND